jgi:regulator of replication initiation timing
MTSRKVHVDVFRGSTVLERITDRPVRLLPDGRAGIAYAGAVYPLLKGDRIDVDDAPVDKRLCHRFLAPTTPIPYAPDRGTPAALLDFWHVEENRFGFYVVFDGSVEVAQAVANRLEEAGLGVRRWDISQRKADDGRTYDWFVRLDYDAPDARERIRDALVPGASPAPRGSADGDTVDSVAPRLVSLEREVDAALGRLQELVARTDALQTLNAALVSENEEMKAEAERDARIIRGLRADAVRDRAALKRATAARDRALADRERTRDELARLLDHGTGAHESRRASDMAQELAKAEDDWVREAEKVDALTQQLDEAMGRVDSLALEREGLVEELVLLRESAQESTERRLVAATPRGGLEAFLARLLRRTQLHPDAIDVLAQLEKPRRILKVLLDLDGNERQGEGTVPSTPLRNLAPWREVTQHLATGAAGATSGGGRVYFAPANGHILVYVQHKSDRKSQDQARNRIRAWRPESIR